jgi:uncharacterized membrane protein YdjX (TVP38/TMEM64 family)
MPLVIRYNEKYNIHKEIAMKKALKKRLLIIVTLLCLIALLYYIGIEKYLNFSYIKEHQQTIQNFIDHHYTTAAILYSCLYACLVFFMISLTLVLTIVAGYFFGTLQATLLSMIGALVGGTLSFLAIRYLLYGWLNGRYHKAVETFKEKFKQHGASYLLSLQFFPLTPSALINIMAGLSGVSFITYFWTTAIGILPITLLASFAGRQFATINTVRDIFSPSIIFALLALSALALLPTIVEFLKKKSPDHPLH